MDKLDAMRAFEVAAKGQTPDPTAASEFAALCDAPGGEGFRDGVEVKRVSPEVDTACFVWVGGKTAGEGYAELMRDGKTLVGHREAFELVNGPIPAGHVVRHLCHTTACVRPSHLTTGTQVDNAADSADRRYYGKRLSKDLGDKRTPVDEENIRIALANGAKQTDLAEEYGTDRGTIRRIGDRGAKKPEQA